MTKATVIRQGALDMQVCVPDTWADADVVSFAEAENPCGTTHGWRIRTEPERLAGKPSRNPCANGGGMVHITLDA